MTRIHGVTKKEMARCDCHLHLFGALLAVGSYRVPDRPGCPVRFIMKRGKTKGVFAIVEKNVHLNASM